MPGLGTGASVTTAQNVLKVLYPQKRLRDIIYKNNPMLGMMPKADDFGGQYIQVSVQIGAGQGASANITNALANYSANNYQAFQLRRLPYYGIGRISGELIRAGRTDKDSLVRTLEQEQKGTNKTLSRQYTHAVFGNGGGALGQVGAVGPGAGLAFPDRGIAAPTLLATQLQLIDPTQVVFFEIDATHVAATTDGTSGAVLAGTPAVVTGVNRSNGVITYNQNVVGVGGTSFNTLVVNDYIFLQGDFGAKMHGLEGWVPHVDPVIGTPFLGIDRGTLDVTRISGLRYNGNGGPIEETLQTALAFCFQEGSDCDTAIMNPLDMQRLMIALNSRTEFYGGVAKRMAKDVDGSDIAEVGYEGVKIKSVNGTCEVFADPGCPKGKGWVMQLDTWMLHTLGEFPGFLEEDGLMMLRDATTDSYVWRMGSYSEIGCEAPGSNLAFTL